MLAPGEWLKVSQGHRKWHFLLVVCSNSSVSFTHGYRNISTFAVYVTAGMLEKSLSFNTTFEITAFPIRAQTS